MYLLWAVTGSCNAIVLGVGLVYRMWLVVFCATVIAAAVGLGLYDERERARRPRRVRAEQGAGCSPRCYRRSAACVPVAGRWRIPGQRQP